MTDEDRIKFLSTCLSSGEIEFGFDAKFNMYYAFAYPCRYVLASDLPSLIDEMRSEAARYKRLKTKPNPADADQFSGYIFRKHRGLFGRLNDHEGEH